MTVEEACVCAVWRCVESGVVSTSVQHESCRLHALAADTSALSILLQAYQHLNNTRHTPNPAIWQFCRREPEACAATKTLNVSITSTRRLCAAEAASLNSRRRVCTSNTHNPSLRQLVKSPRTATVTTRVCAAKAASLNSRQRV